LPSRRGLAALGATGGLGAVALCARGSRLGRDPFCFARRRRAAAIRPSCLRALGWRLWGRRAGWARSRCALADRGLAAIRFVLPSDGGRRPSGRLAFAPWAGGSGGYGRVGRGRAVRSWIAAWP
jgi:hypothetical protein